MTEEFFIFIGTKVGTRRSRAKLEREELKIFCGHVSQCPTCLPVIGRFCGVRGE